jgi:hypothetical protein
MAGDMDHDWFNALMRYIEGVKSHALQSADEAVEYLHGQVQDRARELPGWSELADDITVWADNGMLWIGVNNQDRVSQAFALEYGDEERPPIPLFRTLAPEFQQTGQMMANAHRARYGQ